MAADDPRSSESFIPGLMTGDLFNPELEDIETLPVAARRRSDFGTLSATPMTPLPSSAA
jgi:hypothetical protein